MAPSTIHKSGPMTPTERQRRWREKARKQAAAHYRGRGTGENHWFTPLEHIEAAREVMGNIDVDPASHPDAQRWIGAAQFYTRKSNGLDKPWFGRVWLNPPYARDEIGPFIEKLGVEIDAGRTTEAILLTHAYTDTLWFQKAVLFSVGSCFTLGRIKFIDINYVLSNPTQGQTFFYYGCNWERFCRVFSEFGVLCQWQLPPARQPDQRQEAAD